MLLGIAIVLIGLLCIHKLSAIAGVPVALVGIWLIGRQYYKPEPAERRTSSYEDGVMTYDIPRARKRA